MALACALLCTGGQKHRTGDSPSATAVQGSSQRSKVRCCAAVRARLWLTSSAARCYSWRFGHRTQKSEVVKRCEATSAWPLKPASRTTRPSNLKPQNIALPRHCTCYILLNLRASLFPQFCSQRAMWHSPLDQLPNSFLYKAAFLGISPVHHIETTRHQCAHVDTSLLNTSLDTFEVFLGPGLSTLLLSSSSRHEITFCPRPHRSGLPGICFEPTNSELRCPGLLRPPPRLEHSAITGGPPARLDTRGRAWGTARSSHILLS